MNRRGFIGIIASALAGTKKAFGLLPAAASSPTPCAMWIDPGAIPFHVKEMSRLLAIMQSTPIGMEVFHRNNLDELRSGVSL